MNNHSLNVPNIVIIAIFGASLIVQYILLATGHFDLSRDQMWGYSPKEFRLFSIFSITLAFLAGLYMAYYYSFRVPSEPNVVQIIGLLLLVGVSNLWIISMIFRSKVGTQIVLILVALGALMLYPGTDSIPAITGYSILVFQTLIMDAIVWGYYNINN